MGKPPQSVEGWRCLEAAGEVSCKRLKLSNQFDRIGLRGDPAAKLGDSFDEIDIGPPAQIRGRRAGAEMLQTKTRQPAQSGLDTMRIVLGNSGDRVIHPSGTVQPPPEPSFEHSV